MHTSQLMHNKAKVGFPHPDRRPTWRESERKRRQRQNNAFIRCPGVKEDYGAGISTRPTKPETMLEKLRREQNPRRYSPFRQQEIRQEDGSGYEMPSQGPKKEEEVKRGVEKISF